MTDAALNMLQVWSVEVWKERAGIERGLLASKRTIWRMTSEHLKAAL